MAAQYDSADMHSIRRRLAGRLLTDRTTLDVEDTLLVFFENLAILSRKHLLDRDLVWNTFAFDVRRYWHVLSGYVELSRQTCGDPTLYEEFERLALASDLAGRLHSPLGTKLPPLDLTQEAMQKLLGYESRVGGGS
jgi:hypothetical protein